VTGSVEPDPGASRCSAAPAEAVAHCFEINTRWQAAEPELDQREADEIFGGGVNAFSRYENGKTKPPLSLVKLLQVLDKHPDLLGEIRVS
jgi:DNA-binding transcriptional regulator YiaG